MCQKIKDLRVGQYFKLGDSIYQLTDIIHKESSDEVYEYEIHRILGGKVILASEATVEVIAPGHLPYYLARLGDKSEEVEIDQS